MVKASFYSINLKQALPAAADQTLTAFRRNSGPVFLQSCFHSDILLGWPGCELIMLWWLISISTGLRSFYSCTTELLLGFRRWIQTPWHNPVRYTGVNIGIIILRFDVELDDIFMLLCGALFPSVHQNISKQSKCFLANFRHVYELFLSCHGTMQAWIMHHMLDSWEEMLTSSNEAIMRPSG